jgi:hypothetical protein
MRPKRYGPLKRERRLRLKRKANARFKRRHPSHRMKYGHNFVENKVYDRSNPVCLKCGMKR